MSRGVVTADLGRLRRDPLPAALFGALLALAGTALLPSPLGGATADPLTAMGVVLSEQGKEAPDFGLPDPEGKRMALRDFRGKAVLLTFFTTW